MARQVEGLAVGNLGLVHRSALDCHCGDHHGHALSNHHSSTKCHITTLTLHPTLQAPSVQKALAW